MITLTLFVIFIILPILGLAFAVVATLIVGIVGAVAGTVVGVTDKRPITDGQDFGFNPESFTASGGGSVKTKEPFLTEEEILAAGLYPNDEGYEMSLISSILNK